MEGNRHTDYEQEAYNDFSTGSHISKLLKAAAPYVSLSMQESLDLLAKTMDFTDAIQGFQKKGGLTAFDYRQPITDIPGMLNSIRPHCTDKERELVDMILGFYNMKGVFETYQTLSSLMPMMGAGNAQSPVDAEIFEDFEPREANTQQAESTDKKETSSPFSGMQMMDMLGEMLSPEQKSTFETMKMLLDSGMLNGSHQF